MQHDWHTLLRGGGGGGDGAHHIALPSSPCLTTAPPSEVHTSTLLPPSKSTTSNNNLTTTEILYNSRPKPLSPHPQLTYVTTTPRSSLELQGCDHNDTSLLTAASGGATTSDVETNSNTTVRQSLDPIVSLTSFVSQHKNHTNLLPCLDSSTNNSSSISHNHGRQPSVDEDLLLVATSLAGMKRRRPGTRNTWSTKMQIEKVDMSCMKIEKRN